MSAFSIALCGKAEGQRSHLTVPGNATIANFLIWLYTMTDAGVTGVSAISPQAFVKKDPEDGANTDKKLEIHAKSVTDGEKIRFVIPAYKDNMVETTLTNRGEVVTQESGQVIVDGYKIAAGYGAKEFVFTSGRVKQTL